MWSRPSREPSVRAAIASKSSTGIRARPRRQRRNPSSRPLASLNAVRKFGVEKMTVYFLHLYFLHDFGIYPGDATTFSDSKADCASSPSVQGGASGGAHGISRCVDRHDRTSVDADRATS